MEWKNLPKVLLHPTSNNTTMPRNNMQISVALVNKNGQLLCHVVGCTEHNVTEINNHLLCHRHRQKSTAIGIFKTDEYDRVQAFILRKVAEIEEKKIKKYLARQQRQSRRKSQCFPKTVEKYDPPESNTQKSQELLYVELLMRIILQDVPCKFVM